MNAALELEAAVSSYLEILGLRQPEALVEATNRVCERFNGAADGRSVPRAIALARSWAIAFCQSRDADGQAWLEVPTTLAKWPMTFACSDLPTCDSQVDVSLVTPPRAALVVREQEIDVSIASLATATNAMFQDVAFTVLEWARFRP